MPWDTLPHMAAPALESDSPATVYQTVEFGSHALSGWGPRFDLHQAPRGSIALASHHRIRSGIGELMFAPARRIGVR